ncbi:hypothetical protein HDU83_007614 [Entophlyctis luteolus]|nr:hypothetical protein HDU82_006307 [Entophlyctis luteolus]KAJ3352812.1 hypothetical protein HDU83_007614 [Entophlyctis luteolus]KAJ3379384.1 hypothetical protein HDU84_006716 [Entophlyctis sp. JEL0112]
MHKRGVGHRTGLRTKAAEARRTWVRDGDTGIPRTVPRPFESLLREGSVTGDDLPAHLRDSQAYQDRSSGSLGFWARLVQYCELNSLLALEGIDKPERTGPKCTTDLPYWGIASMADGDTWWILETGHLLKHKAQFEQLLVQLHDAGWAFSAEAITQLFNLSNDAE